MPNLWLTFVLFASLANMASATYVVAPLPPGGGNVSAIPLAISAYAAVGYSTAGSAPNGTYRATLWIGDQTLSLTAPEGANSTASAVNSFGIAAGAVLLPGAALAQPAFWSNGQLHVLPTLSMPGGTAWSVNDAGDIVGTIGDAANGVFSPVLWHAGQVQILGTFPATQATAVSINNSGQILIQVNGENASKPWIWENGSLTPIPSLGGDFSAASDINSLGHVVGDSTLGSSRTEGFSFLYKGDGTQALSPLPFDEFTVARALNDADIVVGSGYDSDTGSHAILWANGLVFNLNDLLPVDSGWNLYEAYDIDNSGRIVGIGSYNGQMRGFLLTPAASDIVLDVPEPSAGLLLLFAFPLLHFGIKRSQPTDKMSQAGAREN